MDFLHWATWYSICRFLCYGFKYVALSVLFRKDWAYEDLKTSAAALKYRFSCNGPFLTQIRIGLNPDITRCKDLPEEGVNGCVISWPAPPAHTYLGICFSSVKWNLYTWAHTFNSQGAMPWKSPVWKVLADKLLGMLESSNVSFPKWVAMKGEYHWMRSGL